MIKCLIRVCEEWDLKDGVHGGYAVFCKSVDLPFIPQPRLVLEFNNIDDTVDELYLEVTYVSFNVSKMEAIIECKTDMHYEPRVEPDASVEDKAYFAGFGFSEET